MSNFDPFDHLKITLNLDGTLTRHLNLPIVEANPEPKPGSPIVSKDVPLIQENKTWVRIFRPTKLPSNDNMVARLPILVYFHHGGWIYFNPDDLVAHTNCSQLASEIPAIVVSVSFRLAPESRLPEQYKDAVDGILWVKQQACDPNGEPWLRDYGDWTRCYLYGCGSGGNIAFFSGLKVPDLQLEPMKIAGIVLNQPMFGGLQRTKSELKFAADQLMPLPVIDLMWDLVLPKGTNRDHRYCNPMVMGPHRELISKMTRCLVIGFGGDPMVDWQQQFVTMLVNCGVHVEARFEELGFHNIDFVDSRRASEVLNIVKEFII
ncbi:Alpha/beta hydrolase fold [Quillaja saponaria]|uniref:Alpha/beta hydrolase fold n=1 Tax=Quillaja saponaria TaxID=32244 RepID=A0AAD7LQB6_QUISA|nr:Alpha/beta hydrolase fold [Quillaja saponaria]